MSMTSSFGFTNTTASTKTVTPVNLDPLQDYAMTEDTATDTSYANKTCPGQKELLSFQCSEIKKVSSKLTNYYPPRVEAGVQYIARLDELLRTYGDNGDILFDEPIVMYLTVRHPHSSVITAAMIEEIFKRLIGSLQRDDGTWRFDDLMLSALTITQD